MTTHPMIANLSDLATAASPFLAPTVSSLVDSILHEADTNYARGDWLSARDCLSQAVALSPRHPRLHDALGCLHFRLKNYPEACAAFTIALYLTPDNPDLLTQMAMTLIELNKPSEAEAALRQALALRSGHPAAQQLVGSSNHDPQGPAEGTPLPLSPAASKPHSNQCRPDFFIISPPKTGSSWLSVNLGCHPNIFVPPQKELKYFSNYYKIQHFDSYLNNFKGGGSRIKGDASPSYAILPTATIRSVRELFPDLKLIFLMRDPVERAWSHAKHSFKYRHINFKNYTGSWDTVPDEKLIDNFIHPWPLAFGNYEGALRNWLRVFPKEQVFVGFYEEIIKNPKQLLQRIFDFLGVGAPMDWSNFNLEDRILRGIPEKLPERLRLCLQMLYVKKSKELVYYLRREFNEEVPCEWTGSLTVPPPDDLTSPELNWHRAVEVRQMAINNGSIEALEEDFSDEVVEKILAMDDEPVEPLLVEENYRGYNLLQHRARFYGLSQSLGAMDLGRTADPVLHDLQQRQLCFIADDVPSLKGQIAERGFRVSPELIEENYHGFNLVAFKDRFIALSPSLGPVDLDNLEPEKLREWQALRTAFVAPSLAALKAAVTPVDAEQAELLADDYCNYRITEYRGIFYAIPKHLGRVNMENPGERNLPEILSSRDRAGLRRMIDRAVVQHAPIAPPRLLGQSYRGYNLFAFSSLFLAVEAKWHELDLERVRVRDHGPFFSSTDFPGLKQQIDESACGNQGARAGHALLICRGGATRTKQLLDRLGYSQVTLLLTDPTQDSFGLPALRYEPQSAGLLDKLRDGNFDVVIVPYDSKLGAVAWEQFAAQFCRQLLAVYPDGSTRYYRDDHFSRILYNMAYLRSMFSKVPPMAGQRVLEVGCSDGLPCDIVAREGPASVVGVDMLDTVGLLYQNPLVTYRKLDATMLPFDDNSFDLVYSIATFEHVANTLAAFNEMKRVLRPGGYGYVQTAPFYYTPFGHHMFGYFDHYPWIHVRLSKTEIAEYARQSGLAAKIESARGGSAENYIEAMINLQHVNGKLLREYRVEEFGAQADVEIVSFQRSYEGEKLVTPEILAEVKPVRREDLITHGFELVFRVK